MILTVITLLTALLIAGVAAWFSIAGLMAIFPAAPIAILIMGVVLELGKLTSASWLYRNWDETPLLLKSYLTGAVVVLMLITSMGIFGFLSKAHIDQAAPVGNNEAKIARLEQRIDYEERQIEDFEKIIKQLDIAVETLVKYDKISGETGAIAVRKQQKGERDEMSANISSTQMKIDEYEDERAELSGKIREFELEVGPLRYIADMIYEEPDTKLESAVRLVIIIIIFVFDPLAVLLLIAANFSLTKNKKKDNTPTETVNTSNEMDNSGEDKRSVNSGSSGKVGGSEAAPRETIRTTDTGVREDDEAAESLGQSETHMRLARLAPGISGYGEEAADEEDQDTHIEVPPIPKDEDTITDGSEPTRLAKAKNWLNTGRRYYEQKD